MRTIILSFLLLVAMDLPIGAQSSAWILWMKSSQEAREGKPVRNEVSWTPMDGFADIKECRAKGEAELALLTKIYEVLEYKPAFQRERHSMFAKGKMEEAVTFDFLCFPANFDPRK
jgi:hypothetical protein